MSDLASSDASPERRHHPLASRASALLALVLIGFWMYALVRSVVDNHLYLGPWTWTFANPTLSDDFHYHIDHTARVLAAGRSIESETDIFCRLFPYPLMIPRLFCWVAWMSPRTAIAVWTGALAAIFLGSTWAVFRSRQRLQLTRVSPLWLLVLVLYATPVLSAIERGQCDPLTILFLIGASALLRSRRRPGLSETGAGGLLGLAAWIKFYPGLVVVALFSMRKWRALTAFLVVAGSIGIMDFHSTLRAIANGRQIASTNTQSMMWLSPIQHSIGTYWPRLWENTVLNGLCSLPGPAVSVLLLGPIVALVGWRVWRVNVQHVSNLSLPLLLWIVAAGTFALPYSNDYNLIFLPLAILAVYDRRDPLWIALSLGLVAVYWQPIASMIDPRVLFLGKLFALYGAGWSLRCRADELIRMPVEVGPSSVSCSVPTPHLGALGEPGRARFLSDGSR